MRNSKRCDLSFIPCHFIRSPSRLRAISVISVPDLALADRAIYHARVTRAIKVIWSFTRILNGCESSLWVVCRDDTWCRRHVLSWRFYFLCWPICWATSSVCSIQSLESSNAENKGLAAKSLAPGVKTMLSSNWLSSISDIFHLLVYFIALYWAELQVTLTTFGFGFPKMPSNSAFKRPFSPSFSASEALIEEIKELQNLQRELSAPFVNVWKITLCFWFTFIVIPEQLISLY